MANTFLAAQGMNVGKSLCEHEMLDNARAIMEKAKKAGCEIVLPTDAVVAAEFKEGAASTTVPVDSGTVGQDDPRRRPEVDRDLNSRLAGYKTLVWNGPLGAFEVTPFDTGTNAVAREAAKLTKAGQAAERRRRRRHGGGAGACRRRGRLLLRLDGGRRLPRVDGGQDASRRRGVAQVSVRADSPSSVGSASASRQRRPGVFSRRPAETAGDGRHRAKACLCRAWHRHTERMTEKRPQARPSR